jgi:DHA1 family multidrug resistance protein-like MFS transporter
MAHDSKPATQVKDSGSLTDSARLTDEFPDSARKRNLIATCIASGLASIGFLFVIPIFPLYIMTLIDGDIAEAAAWSGLAIGISPLLSATTGPFWGVLGQRMGEKAMLMRSVACIGLATAVMAFATHPVHLVGARILIGLFGGIPVASMAAITASARRNELGRAIAALQSSQMVGSTVGPLMGGTLATVFGFRSSFLVAAGLFGAALVVASWLYRNPPRPVSTTARRNDVSAVRPRSIQFWAPLGALFLANFIDSSFMALLPVVIGPLGAPVECVTMIAGMGISAAGVAVVIAANVAGRMEGRFPPFRVISIALGITSVLMLSLTLITDWWQFLGVRFLVAIVAGGVPTLAFSAAAAQAPANQRGKAVGIATSIGMLGWAASPYVSGLMVGFGLRYLYVGAALALVGCSVMVMVAAHRAATASSRVVVVGR